MKKYAAELLGTFWLVFGGCGSAVLAAVVMNSGVGGVEREVIGGLGIGYLGVSLAFGLTVVTMAYAIGHISGCHLNPAVTIGQVVAGRFPASDAIPYIVAQVIGGLIAGFVLMLIAQDIAGFSGLGGFATNGYGAGSPQGFGMTAALLIEIILTFVFLMVILGATDGRAPAGFAPIAIGLCLTLIHLISIPVTNTSVNPARSTGVAFFADTAAFNPAGQLWLFWVAPIIGAVIAGVVYKWLGSED